MTQFKMTEEQRKKKREVMKRYRAKQKKLNPITSNANSPAGGLNTDAVVDALVNSQPFWDRMRSVMTEVAGSGGRVVSNESLIERISGLKDAGHSHLEISNILNNEHLFTRRIKQWDAGKISDYLRRVKVKRGTS